MDLHEGRVAAEKGGINANDLLALARAITWAESDKGGGELKLLRNRDRQTETVVIKLPVMGMYSATAPVNCPKTKRVVENAAAFLAGNTPAQGDFNLTGALNALLLYATGDDRYLDLVRRTACRMSINHTINDAGHETWRWGYMNMCLCEYYLATGDKRVLPTIQQFCDVLAAGQCNPGTWGHRGVPDFIPPGTPLFGATSETGGSWRMLPDGKKAAEGWTSVEFDDSAWTSVALPAKALAKGPRYLRRTFTGVAAEGVENLMLEYALIGHMQVYLNGNLIMDVNGGGWPKVISIPLKPVTTELLNAEKNCLAAVLTPKPGDQDFDIVFKALMKSAD